MDGSICIITPAGMKCLDSPMTSHGPAWGDVAPDDGRAARVQSVRDAVRGVYRDSTDMAEIIEAIVDLLDASSANVETPFAIWRKPKPRRSGA